MRLSRLGLVAVAALAVAVVVASVAYAEVPMYTVFEGKVLKPGQAVAAAIMVPTGPRPDPNVIGVTVSGSEWPDRFVAAYYHSDGAYVAVWLGKRGSSWSENEEVWREPAKPGSKHEVVITFKGGTVTFEVDGKAVYSFSTSAKELRVIYYNVNYKVGNAVLTSLGSSSSKWLVIGVAGVGVLAVVIALMIPPKKGVRRS